MEEIFFIEGLDSELEGLSFKELEYFFSIMGEVKRGMVERDGFLEEGIFNFGEFIIFRFEGLESDGEEGEEVLDFDEGSGIEGDGFLGEEFTVGYLDNGAEFGVLGFGSDG